jgi:serine protease Do
VPRGVGSGFLISADGYLLTNNHVVDGSDEITVTLQDKREFKGKLIGSDKRSDVAVVKIEGTDLPTLKIGDPAKLRVGEWVIAIGSPFNLENTVTAGIVSAKSRDTGELLPFIQTDAAVNPGNSGGPLINVRGEVVGINSQIFTTSGSYAGISFAIPIDEAMKIAKLLRTQGKVVRGKIGVLIGEVSDRSGQRDRPAQGLRRRGLQRRGGRAGRQGRDPAGRRHHQVRRQGRGELQGPAPGRGRHHSRHQGQRDRVARRRGQGPDAHRGRDARRRRAASARGGRNRPGKVARRPIPDALGLVVSDPDPAQLKELHLDGAVQVESADGAAASAGMRPGDLILSVNAAHVKNSKQYKDLVAKLDLGKADRAAGAPRRPDQPAVLHAGDN